MDNIALINLLSLPLLGEIEAERINDLGLRPQLRKFASGSLLFDRGDDSRDVFFLISGKLLCVFWTADGKEILFNRIQTKGYFGQLSAIDGGSRSLSVYCQSASEAVVLSQADFLRMISLVPEISARVMGDLAAMVRSLTLRCYETSSRSVKQRVQAYLADMALRSGNPLDIECQFDLPSHAEIASSIGANREAVTRAMSELNRAKVIESSRKSVRVLAPEYLVEVLAD